MRSVEDRLLLLFLWVAREDGRIRRPFADYARHLDVKRPAIREAIASLREQGLITTRTVNEHGIRRCQIGITRRGERRIDEIREGKAARG